MAVIGHFLELADTAAAKFYRRVSSDIHLLFYITLCILFYIPDLST